jgi:hypothetical protein
MKDLQDVDNNYRTPVQVRRSWLFRFSFVGRLNWGSTWGPLAGVGIGVRSAVLSPVYAYGMERAI